MFCFTGARRLVARQIEEVVPESARYWRDQYLAAKAENTRLNELCADLSLQLVNKDADLQTVANLAEALYRHNREREQME